MAQKNDQIFQLSLTEIAFTIAFILLLLLGYQVAAETRKSQAAIAELEKIRSIESAIKALDLAKAEISKTLNSVSKSNPLEVITKLVAVDEIRAERDKLKVELTERDDKITALIELKELVDNTDHSSKKSVAKSEIESALALQSSTRKLFSDFNDTPAIEAEISRTVKQALETTNELKRQFKTQLGKDLMAGQEAKAIEELVSLAKIQSELDKNGTNPSIVKKENSDLRGQVAFLKNKLDARGGRDYPPCWADENGKVEFLFSVDLKADSLLIEPAWPHKRATDAANLPGISDVISGNPHSYKNFTNVIQGIFKKSHSDQCRHYVQLKSSISDAVHSDRARLMIENYFYKMEIRR